MVNCLDMNDWQLIELQMNIAYLDTVPLGKYQVHTLTVYVLFRRDCDADVTSMLFALCPKFKKWVHFL